jgi:hypothetical protein
MKSASIVLNDIGVLSEQEVEETIYRLRQDILELVPEEEDRLELNQAERRGFGFCRTQLLGRLDLYLK